VQGARYRTQVVGHRVQGAGFRVEEGMPVSRKNEAGPVLERLRSLSDRDAIEGMARFGINPENTLGIPVPVIRGMAKELGRDHFLAQELWNSGVHEARILAGFIDDPKLVTEDQMERWVTDFDSWDVCDQVCGSLFDRTPMAYGKAVEWSARDEEFVKRAGFVLMASLSVHDKKADDKRFLHFLPVIKRGAVDERNFVKKAVNWALRQIGKRNVELNRAAIKVGRELAAMSSRSARWIASDALRELEGEAVRERLLKKNNI
jgi:3-methyladenine DNA glycosylase AlkD